MGFCEAVLAAVVTNDKTIDLSAFALLVRLSWRVPVETMGFL